MGGVEYDAAEEGLYIYIYIAKYTVTAVGHSAVWCGRQPGPDRPLAVFTD